MNIKQLVIRAALPACAVWLLGLLLPMEYRTSAGPVIIVFLTLLNILFNRYFVKLSEGKEMKDIAGILMALIGFKFLITIFVVGAYLFINSHEQHLGFALNFFVIYMIFAVYETQALLAYTKEK